MLAVALPTAEACARKKGCELDEVEGAVPQRQWKWRLGQVAPGVA